MVQEESYYPQKNSRAVTLGWKSTFSKFIILKIAFKIFKKMFRSIKKFYLNLDQSIDLSSLMLIESAPPPQNIKIISPAEFPRNCTKILQTHLQKHPLSMARLTWTDWAKCLETLSCQVADTRSENQLPGKNFHLVDWLHW